MRFRYLDIKKFRHVKPVRLEFSTSAHVLLGRNGTGKSTMLDLLQNLLYFDFNPYRGESFAFDYGIEIEAGGTRALIDFSIEVEEEDPWERAPSANIALSGEPKFWSYEITAARGEHKNIVRADSSGERFAETTHPGLEHNGLFPDIFDELFLRRLLYRFEGTNGAIIPYQTDGLFHQGKFTEGLDAFDHMTGKLSGQYGYDNNRRSVWFLSGDVLGVRGPKVLLKVLEFDKICAIEESGERSARGNDALDSLTRFVSLAGYSNAKIKLKKVRQSKVPNRGWDIHFEGADFEVFLNKTNVIHHNLLSYGEKRLLSYLFYLEGTGKGGITICDELSNGMHHGWVRSLAEQFDERQGFFATHSPSFMDCLSFESAEEVQRSLILFRSVVEDDSERKWSWGHPTASEANQFYRAFDVGIMHVSEILKTKGLW